MIIGTIIALGAISALAVGFAPGVRARLWIAGVLGVAQAVALALLAAGAFPGAIVSPLGRVAALGLACAWFAASLAAPAYYGALVEHGEIQVRGLVRTLVLTQLFTTALAVAAVSSDLALSWVMLEVTTMTGAFLVAFDGSERRLEAAWKFAVLCFAGVGFGLVGIGALAVAHGEGAAATSFAELARFARYADPGAVRLAFAALVAGFGTKAGFVPLHWWLPDAHSQAPAPVSALMSGGLVATALVVLAEARDALAPALGSGAFAPVFIAVGLLGLALAVFSMVGQPDLKRLLAYSTVEHIALMAIALGIGSPLAAVAFAIHLVGHAALKAPAFLAAGGLVESAGSSRIDRIAGSLSRDRRNAATLLVSVGLLGAPPGPLFVSEILIVYAAVNAGMAWLAVAVTVLLAIGFAAFAERTLAATLGKAKRKAALRLPAFYSVAPAVLVTGAAILVLARPGWLLGILRGASVAISGGAPW